MKSRKMPWMNEYKVFGIPKSLKPYPNKPVYDILEQAATKYGKNGLIQNNYKITYVELKNQVNRLATALSRMGLKKGDRVITILPSSIQFCLADYAISRAGLVQVPCSHLEPAAHLEHKFKEAKPGAIIFLDEYIETVKAVVKKSKINNVIVTSLDDYSNNPPAQYGKIDIKGALWMKELINNTEAAPPELSYDVEKDLEILLFTGGTTGLPKGCMLTHRNIYANSLQNLYVLGKAGLLLRGSISVILGLPFFHSFGHVIMHSMTFFGFNQILITDPRDTKTMIQSIKEYRPLMQIGVPTQFMKLCEEELSGIGMLGLSGSAPLPPNAQKEFEKKSGGGIMEGYGLSEMSPVTHLNTTYLVRIFGGRAVLRFNSMLFSIPGYLFLLNALLRLLGTKNVGVMLTSLFALLTKLTADKGNSSKKEKKKKEKRGTIGIPFPDTDVRIIEVGTGVELSWDEVIAGKPGEMILNGPQRMLGYWPNPGEGVDDEGFIHTSDVVKVDDRGYFYIVDRTKDMIIVSGYKVYSREIDDILYSHEAVDIAATIGIPDTEREGSERVIVYVQPKPEFRKKIKEKDIIEYLKAHVPKYAIPKKVYLINEIPLTEVQKVNKKELRKMAMKDFKIPVEA